MFPEVWVGVGQETCKSIREGGGVDFLNNPIVYFVAMYTSEYDIFHKFQWKGRIPILPFQG